MEVSDQLHPPAALLPVPVGLEAGWAAEPVNRSISRWTNESVDQSVS